MWGTRPDDTWGKFLDRLDEIMEPSLLQSVILVQEEDWHGVKTWCTSTSAEQLGEIIDAALSFQQTPEPSQVLRVSRSLEPMTNPPPRQ
ncbi:unnamed protein product [Effrenium voratum]|nr:unnamed protein product [Effrenium voratum]